MRITKEGFAIVEGDMLLSRYVEEQGRLDVDYELTDKMRPYIPKGGVVVDVGACIGDHTVAYAEMVGPEGLVYAFEPNPIAFECLQYNTKAYANIIVYPVGLGLSAANLSVWIDAHNIGACRLVASRPYGDHATVVKLDDLAATWEQLDFIKIDAEGFEPYILMGAPRTLRRLHPAILIEINDEMLGHNEFTRDHVYAALREAGYKDFETSTRHSYDLLCK